MNKILFILLSGFVTKQCGAQVETAINWTKEDCNTETTTTLFDILDSNIVVVQEYIMTNCTPCISVGTLIANLLAEYDLSYPGKVVGYQTGHDNYLGCDDMIEWADTNDFNTTTLFNMGADEIDYYGIMGMPTLLVLGGSDHKVFYYHLGLLSTIATQKELQIAIDSALIATGVTLSTGISDIYQPIEQVMVYPNPAQNILNIEFDDINHELHIELSDFTGKRIESFLIHTSTSIDISNFSNGLYFLTLTDSNNKRRTIPLVKEGR